MEKNLDFNRALLMLFIMLFLAVSFSYPVFAESEFIIDSCMEINSAGSYVLDKNINFDSSPGGCLKINANDIKINCQNYLISSSNSGQVAITVSGQRAEIQNCRISMKEGTGISLLQSSDSIIKNNFINWSRYSIFSYDSDRNLIADNMFDSNDYGVTLVTGSDDNKIIRNKMNSDWQYSIHIQSSRSNSILNNSISGGYYGVFLESSSDTMIKENKFLRDYIGIASGNESSNILIFGNYFEYNYNSVLLEDSKDIDVSGNNINGGGYGIFMSRNMNASISFNNFFDNIVSGVYLLEQNGANINDNVIDSKNTSGSSIWLAKSNENMILENSIKKSLLGLTLDASSKNLIKDNIIENSASNAIGLFAGSRGNIFENNAISNSILDAVLIYSGSEDNFFDELRITGTNQNFRDIRFDGQRSDNTTFEDSFLSRYDFGPGNEVVFRASNKGEIRFIEKVSGSGESLSRDIKISDNFVFINESVSGINKPAVIKLYNIPEGLRNYRIFRNDAVCSGTICTPISEIGPGNVSFSATLGGKYMIKSDSVQTNKDRDDDDDNERKFPRIINTYPRQLSEKSEVIKFYEPEEPSKIEILSASKFDEKSANSISMYLIILLIVNVILLLLVILALLMRRNNGNNAKKENGSANSDKKDAKKNKNKPDKPVKHKLV